jgi:hypothetical protein
VRTSPSPSARHAARARDLVLASEELERLANTPGGKAERPVSLRDAIVRWLNEEL